MLSRARRPCARWSRAAPPPRARSASGARAAMESRPAGPPALPLDVAGLDVRLGGRDILRGVSLRLEPGLRTVILGANGAGKSVLLRALHGLVPIASGRITWAGGPRPPGAEAMVFQRPVMLRRSAVANVEYALALNRVAGSGPPTP